MMLTIVVVDLTMFRPRIRLGKIRGMFIRNIHDLLVIRRYAIDTV